MEASSFLPTTLQRVLPVCGLLASFLKVGADILEWTLWKGYNPVSRSMSELSAAGAPTRTLALPLDLVFNALMIAFAVGIWQVSSQNPLARIAAALIAGNAAITAFVDLFLPMRISPDGIPTTSAIHVALMATAVFFFLFAIGFGGTAFHNWFRYLSFGILILFFVLTIARLVFPPSVTAVSVATTTGIQERTMVAGYLIWVAAFAIQLLSK